MITATAAEDQLAKIEGERLIAEIALIPEVEAIDVEPYIDHTGDRALQLTFHIRKGVQISDDAFFQRFFDFKGLIQTSILQSDLGRFPYTQLKQAA